MRWLRGISIALWCGTACGQADVGRDRVQVTDSAGVELVRNRHAGFDTTVITMVEELRIGAVDGAEHEQFYRILGVEVDALRRILVANYGTSSIRVFDWDGAFVREIGQRGEGPGEFRGVSTPIVHGDTLGISDQELMRFSLFDTAGSFRTSWSMMTPERRAVFPVGASEGGWVVWMMSYGGFDGATRQPGEVTRDTTRMGRLGTGDLQLAPSEGTAFVDSALQGAFEWESGPVTWVPSEGFVNGCFPLFSQNRWWAVDGAGRFYLSHGPEYRIDVFGGDGTLERRISRDFEAIPITDGLVDDYIGRLEEVQRNAAPSQFDRVANARRCDAVTRLPHLPPTRRIFVSDSGALWVERLDVTGGDLANYESIPGSEQRNYYYDVFNESGHYLYTVKPPERFLPRWIGEGIVIGIQRDENDVEFIVRYRLK